VGENDGAMAEGARIATRKNLGARHALAATSSGLCSVEISPREEFARTQKMMPLLMKPRTAGAGRRRKARARHLKRSGNGSLRRAPPASEELALLPPSRGG